MLPVCSMHFLFFRLRFSIIQAFFELLPVVPACLRVWILGPFLRNIVQTLILSGLAAFLPVTPLTSPPDINVMWTWYDTFCKKRSIWYMHDIYNRYLEKTLNANILSLWKNVKKPRSDLCVILRKSSLIRVCTHPFLGKTFKQHFIKRRASI